MSCLQKRRPAQAGQALSVEQLRLQASAPVGEAGLTCTPPGGAKCCMIADARGAGLCADHRQSEQCMGAGRHVHTLLHNRCTDTCSSGRWGRSGIRTRSGGPANSLSTARVVQPGWRRAGSIRTGRARAAGVSFCGALRDAPVCCAMLLQHGDAYGNALVCISVRMHRERVTLTNNVRSEVATRAVSHLRPTDERPPTTRRTHARIQPGPDQ